MSDNRPTREEIERFLAFKWSPELERILNAHLALLDERDSLRAVLAWAYQFAGVYGASVWILDNLSDAANGRPLRHELGFIELPAKARLEIDADAQSQQRPAPAERIVIARSSLDDAVSAAGDVKSSNKLRSECEACIGGEDRMSDKADINYLMGSDAEELQNIREAYAVQRDSYYQERKLSTKLLDENANLKRDKERQWQPIETAPKDGTRVFLFDSEIWIGQWISKDDCNLNEDGDIAVGWTDFHLTDELMSVTHAPTHWQPLPDPPAMESTASEGEPKA